MGVYSRLGAYSNKYGIKIDLIHDSKIDWIKAMSRGYR